MQKRSPAVPSFPVSAASASSTHKYVSPSVQDGIDEESEMKIRISAVEFIQQLSHLLDVPQTTCATACTYFHQFFYRFSLAKFDKDLVAAACVFLACKVEENIRRLRDVVNVFYKIRFPSRKTMSLAEPELIQMRELFADYEQIVLRALSFDMNVDLPYPYLMHYVRSLFVNQKDENSLGRQKTLLQVAWGILNDSYRSNVCLHYKAPEIAVACLYAASEITQIAVESPPATAASASASSTEDAAATNNHGTSTGSVPKRPWCMVFGVTEIMLNAVLQQILPVYKVASEKYEQMISFSTPSNQSAVTVEASLAAPLPQNQNA